jgi:peptide/nickel transport system substrate-binding protein
MQQMWKDIGVKVKLEFVENWGQVLETRNGRQMFDYSSTMMYPDPVGHLWRLWGEKGVFQSRKAWFNEEFNQLGQTLETSNDLEERRKVFRRMLEIYQNEDPAGTYLHQLAMFYGKSKDIDWKPDVVEYLNLRPDGLKFN